MNANDKIAEPRVGNGTLVRPRYSSGQMLQEDDLTQAVEYTRALNRLLFRSLLGYGVVCGLVVSREERCGKVSIKISPGLALDCCGEAIQVSDEQTFVLDPSCKPLPDTLCVVLRYRERNCTPRTDSCATDDTAGCISTRVREGYELRILSGDCPACCTCAPSPNQDTRSQGDTESPQNTGTAPRSRRAATRGAVGGAGAAATAAAPTSPDCHCVDPTLACYVDHYNAQCPCCDDCEWVTLARVSQLKIPPATQKTWEVDHSVRRLIRPVLMRDSQAERDKQHLLNGAAT